MLTTPSGGTYLVATYVTAPTFAPDAALPVLGWYPLRAIGGHGPPYTGRVVVEQAGQLHWSPSIEVRIQGKPVLPWQLLSSPLA